MPKVSLVLMDKMVFQESVVHEVTSVLLVNLAITACLVLMVLMESLVNVVLQGQWATLVDAVFPDFQDLLDLKVLLVSLVAR